MLLIRRLISVSFAGCIYSCYIADGAAYFLYMEQHTSCTKTVIMDTIIFLQGFSSELIPFSKVWGIPDKIHDILHKSLNGLVIQYVFYLLFQFCLHVHPEVLAVHFSLLNTIKDIVFPSEACPYSHYDWNLGQVQQCPSSILSQSLDFVRCDKANICFWFKFQKWPALYSRSTL